MNVNPALSGEEHGGERDDTRFVYIAYVFCQNMNH